MIMHTIEYYTISKKSLTARDAKKAQRKRKEGSKTGLFPTHYSSLTTHFPLLLPPTLKLRAPAPKPSYTKAPAGRLRRRGTGEALEHYYIHFHLPTLKLRRAKHFHIFIFAHYLFPSSITSQSRISLPSMVNRTRVRTLCQPWLPAAPGLICRHWILSSYMILRIWE